MDDFFRDRAKDYSTIILENASTLKLKVKLIIATSQAISAPHLLISYEFIIEKVTASNSLFLFRHSFVCQKDRFFVRVYHVFSDTSESSEAGLLIITLSQRNVNVSFTVSINILYMNAMLLLIFSSCSLYWRRKSIR